MVRQPLLAALTLALSILPSVALAQSTGELRDEPYRHRLAFDLGLYHDSDPGSSFTVFSPSFRGAFGIASLGRNGLVQLDIDWRASAYHFETDVGTASGFRALNPYVGVRFGGEGGDRRSRWRARGGFGATAPLTNLYDRDLELSNTAGWSAPLRGGWDIWLSSTSNLALVGRGDFEYRNRYFLTGIEAAIGVLLPLEHDGATRDTIVAPQVGVWAAFRVAQILALGGRFQAVAIVDTRDLSPGISNTEGLLASGPFVRLELGAGFLEAQLLINLDEPFGFGFDEDRYWAFYFQGGAQF